MLKRPSRNVYARLQTYYVVEGAPYEHFRAISSTKFHKPAPPKGCMNKLSELTKEFQNPWLVVENIPGMSCKSIDGDSNECQKCDNGIDWKDCEYLGWKQKRVKRGEEKKYVTQLDQYRIAVFEPLLDKYALDRELSSIDGFARIFLSIAPRHLHFEFPDGKFAGKDVDAIEISEERKIICIPMLPFEMGSMINVGATSEHLVHCLELILDKFPSEQIEVNTYYGSGNIGIRSYLYALMMFVNLHKDGVSKWNFWDYISDDYPYTDEIPADKKLKKSEYHVMESFPFRNV